MRGEVQFYSNTYFGFLAIPKFILLLYLLLELFQIYFQFIQEKQFEWRNTKHRKQWGSILETYAYKILDAKPIEDIGVQDIIRVLKPIWVKKTVTAQRVM